MSVLVFAENWEGRFKKSTYEAVSYASAIAQQLSTECVAVTIGTVNEEDLKGLGKYGAVKVMSVQGDKLKNQDASVYTRMLGEAAQKAGATHVVISFTYTGKALAPRLSVRLKAGLVSGAIALPSSLNPFTVRKKCYSGKGLTDVVINTPIKLVALTPNSYQLNAGSLTAATEAFVPAVTDADYKVISKEVKKTSGKIALTEAELVVSAGRGMKGPENWGMIEQLAEALGAATACSKPVADIGWRPHHEHVGQTGITIGPNLYIAIGISGAIQHLAGVSSSKVIVVINTDKEAPFFKAADYGIVGDAFTVVPQLVEAVKKLKAAHN
jgi:electron transfer flavoprotein alpha subunit